MTAADETDFRRWKKAIEASSEVCYYHPTPPPDHPTTPTPQLKHDEQTSYKGYLMKEGNKLRGKSAEKRWFELQGHTMRYGETEGGKLPGRLDLRGARVICSASSLAFTLEGPILNIEKKGKSYELAALTFEEMRYGERKKCGKWCGFF